MTLTNLLEKCFKILTRASVDRKSDVRNMVVSIIDGDYPSSRIMVLREVDIKQKSFIFFSDRKSEKCRLLRANSSGSLLAWDRKNHVQIRVKGKFCFESDVNNYWDRLGDTGKKSYGNNPFPSTPILYAQQFENIPTISRFTVLKFFADNIDILWLKRERHVRAIYDSRDTWQGFWVVP
tara:strand:- start:32 stop:568 length:537 start_codon:yes stop_codon:yes gene_type:complete